MDRLGHLRKSYPTRAKYVRCPFERLQDPALRRKLLAEFSHTITGPVTVGVLRKYADQRYAQLRANRDASRWLSRVTDADGPDPGYLEQNTLVLTAGSRTVFGIFMDANLVGQIEFDPQDVSAEPGIRSIGYLLDGKMRGQGIATRACTAVISYAFDKMRLKGMEIHRRPDNLPSVKLAKRLEFQGGEPNDRVDGQLLFTMTSEIWRSSHR